LRESLKRLGNRPKPTSPHLQQLRDLAGQPEEQAQLAITLLEPKLGAEVILAALQALCEDPPLAARSPLLRLYAYYEEQGLRRDPAANLRASVLRVLRPLVLPEDTPLLAQATETYVFPPPTFQEEGALLRSAALNALSDVDETLARYHAVRLLANEHTDPMSGEPALSAARLLAVYGEITPLYFYVVQDNARTLPEVLSECLRHLTALPPALVPGLFARYHTTPEDGVLAGLFDLLLLHREGPYELDFLRTFLRTTERFDAYRYVTTVMLTAGRPVLLDELLTAARAEQHPDRLVILGQVLGLMADMPAILDVLTSVNLRAARAHNPTIKLPNPTSNI
jgi:hypothetical protein